MTVGTELLVTSGTANSKHRSNMGLILQLPLLKYQEKENSTVEWLSHGLYTYCSTETLLRLINTVLVHAVTTGTTYLHNNQTVQAAMYVLANIAISTCTIVMSLAQPTPTSMHTTSIDERPQNSECLYRRHFSSEHMNNGN